MFGKLIKYELRYLIRIFAPMWAAVLALCVLSRLTLKPDMDGMMYVEGSEAILPVIIVMLTVFAIITMMIVATVVLLQRFYKGMYGDEGYLMFTLPVTTGSLVHSKGLSAVLMMTVTEIVTLTGIFIMVSYPQLWFGGDQLGMTIPQLWELFIKILEENGLTMLKMLLYVFWGIITALIVMLQSIYLIYLAISVGQLWKTHPVAGAIVAYYVITLLLSGLEQAGVWIVGVNGQDMIMNWMSNGVAYQSALIAMLLYTSIKGLILVTVSFFGTKLILDKKLNIA